MWTATNILIKKIGRDRSVGKSSASQSGDLGFKFQWGLDLGYPMHEWEGKRLPTVKVILHQLAWLTGANDLKI